MISSMRGVPASTVEVTIILSHGIWLLAGEREHFLNHEEFPWFKGASVQEILNVEQPSTGHFRWPDLDVDLNENSIEHPEKYPLTAR